MMILELGRVSVVEAQTASKADQLLRTPGGFRFNLKKAYFEVESRYHRERVVRLGRRAREADQIFTLRNTALQERFGLGFEGDMYHSELFKYQADLVLGARHEWFFRNFPMLRDTEYEAGPVLEYDLRADILQNKPVTATVFARQIEQFIPREFRLSQRETFQDVGGDIRYQSRTLPMRLSVERSSSDIEGVEQDVPGQDRQETTLNYDLEWKPSRDHRLSLDYEYLDRRTQQFDGFELVERWHDLDILDDLRWGPRQKYELQTQFEFRDEGGTFPQDRVRFNPRLRTHHTSDLDTIVQYTLDEQKFTGVRNLLQRIDWGFTRRIYESLTIDGNLFGEVNDFPQSRRGWFMGGDLSADYRKKTPYGRLEGHIGGGFASRQLDDAKTTAPIVREPATFRGAAPTYLDRADVILSSVRVQSLDGAFSYRRDRDYRVIAYGHKTALIRKLGGRIRNNETTLVSYLYVVPAASRIDNTTFSLELAHRFDNGLRPYYRFGVLDEEARVRNFLPFLEEDYTDHTFGIEFKKSRLTLGAEYDIHNSSLFPDEGLRLWADIDLIQRSGTTLNWSVAYSDFEFRGTLPRRTKRFDANLIFEQNLTPTMQLSLAARYANEDDTLDERTEGYSVEGKWNWTIRNVIVEITIEHQDFSDRVEEEADTRIWFRLRRDFLK